MNCSSTSILTNGSVFIYSNLWHCYHLNYIHLLTAFSADVSKINEPSLGIPEQNRKDYLFDLNNTVSSQSNTRIIYISRSQILLKHINQVVVLI